MKKGVGSGAGSGSISQRFGSGDPDPEPTKMSRIPNTAPSYHYTLRRSDFIHAMENDIKPAFGAAAEVLEGYLSRGIINWGEPVQGTGRFLSHFLFFINFYFLPGAMTLLFQDTFHFLAPFSDVGMDLVRTIEEKETILRTRQFWEKNSQISPSHNI
jgi:hypothetical protein